MFQMVLALLTSAVAIAVGVGLYRRVVAAPTSTPRADEIAAAIRAGAEAFLSRQYRTVAIVGLPILVLILLLLGRWYALGPMAPSGASGSSASMANPCSRQRTTGWCSMPGSSARIGAWCP